jgi:hypothetical protein
MGWGAPSCDNPIEVYYDEYKFGDDGASLQDFLIDKAEVPAAKPVAPTVAQPISNIDLPYNTTAKSVSLSGVFNDEAGASNLSLTVSGNSNTAVVKTAAISGTALNLTLVAGTSGVSTLKIKATDKDGLSVETSFRVTVAAPANQAPKVTNAMPDQQLSYNTTSKSISLTNVFTDDKPASELTYSATSSNNKVVGGLSFSNNVLNITFLNAISGSSTIKVKATDKDGLSAETSFTVNVAAPALQAPRVVNAIPDQQLSFNTLTKSISLVNVFSDDKPVGNLNYTVTSSNNLLVAGLAVVNNVLNLTLVGAATGNAVITVKATDEDGLFVQDQFTVSLFSKPPAISQFINTGGTGYTFRFCRPIETSPEEKHILIPEWFQQLITQRFIRLSDMAISSIIFPFQTVLI